MGSARHRRQRKRKRRPRGSRVKEMTKLLHWRIGLLLLAAFLLVPISQMHNVEAHKEKHTPEQLKAFQDVFIEQVRMGDLLFHGDGESEKKFGIVLSKT